MSVFYKVLPIVFLSVAWIVRQMRLLLTHSMNIEAREVHAICVDLVFAFFICPAIVNPDPCGIVEAPISPIARSNLIQVVPKHLEKVQPCFFWYYFYV